MNKATRAKINKYTVKTLTDLFGPPDEAEWRPTWAFPYRDGRVTIVPILDDGSPWLACRLHNPRHVGVDGHTRPRSELQWPEIFTYPSGKCNLHGSQKDTFEVWQRDMIFHLRGITAPDSVERHKVGELSFVTA